MKKSWILCTACCGLLATFPVGPQRGYAYPLPAAAQTLASAGRITIEVTGGEKNSPVENASVYLKYEQERKIAKNKRVELNVKTNREGVAHVPEAPLGRVLVQIVAEGWKTYGRWFDITDAKEPIKIHLDRPPKWY
ncbi:MAG TPA: hypothetical protein VIM00_10005 [Candidatus Acidoferrum sp.]|jgi:hypothetical protein